MVYFAAIVCDLRARWKIADYFLFWGGKKRSRFFCFLFFAFCFFGGRRELCPGSGGSEVTGLESEEGKKEQLDFRAIALHMFCTPSRVFVFETGLEWVSVSSGEATWAL